MTDSTFTIRPATRSDTAQLAILISVQRNLHRHLDWRQSLDWLGTQPFLLLEQDQEILAALACPTDPPGVAWIRLFFARPRIPLQAAWQNLFQAARQVYAGQDGIQFVALALQPWFGSLLEESGFQHHQDIVVLSWENAPLPPYTPPPDIFLRPIEPADIETIAQIDAQSFEPLWVNSIEGVEHAYQQSAYATLAEKNGQIVGFQISTASMFNAHLARLATLPEQQRQGIGQALVYDLMAHFQDLRTWQVTVNTQSTNQKSLHLYQSMGFILTGEKFPVYILDN